MKRIKGVANYTLYPYSTLVVSHQSSSLLNDETVNHSSLSTYSGDIGQAFRFAAYGEYRGWPVKRRGQMKYGLGMDYFFQNFKKKKDEVFISNPDVGPAHTKESYAVDIELSYLSLSIFVGYSL